ncbi:MAG: acylneuraminate cytidylyltransferase family protein [Elusimicrobiota bacterium]|nr:MAG: acylneuraminate cytidylyltransferase family protein [Elusimicrobiota bacterium]
MSTDDAEIAETAKRLGGDVPFMRPAGLATDAALSLPVLQHALAWAEEADGPYDAVLMLQPTSPLRTSADIDAAIELLERTKCESVVGVVDVGGWHPARMKRIVGDGRLENLDGPGEEDMRPRQALPPVYIRNGAIYLSRKDVISSGRMVGNDCRAYVMPEGRSINVDGPADLAAAGYWLDVR